MSKLFISYSHKDTYQLERLHTHMAILKEEGKISAWFDREILAGGILDDQIQKELAATEIFISIVSPDYLNSRYCYQLEFKSALERMKDGQIAIVPVIVQPCDWKSTLLGKLKALPADGKPISEWKNENTAYFNIIEELRRLLDSKHLSENIIEHKSSNDELQITKKEYKVKRDFTEVDIIDFKEKTFDFIKKYFVESIIEINTLSEVQARMLDAEKKTFTCLISNRRKVDSKGYLTVQIQGEAHFGRSDLNYSFSERPSQNIIQLENNFTIERTDYELVWSQRRIFGNSEAKIYNQKEIAEMLWNSFIEQVGIS